MGHPPGYSNGPYVSPEIDREAEAAKHGASPKVAKGVYIVLGVLCVVLFCLLMIALHVPRGE
jgi:hypothetical protein